MKDQRLITVFICLATIALVTVIATKSVLPLMLMAVAFIGYSIIVSIAEKRQEDETKDSE